MKTFIKVICVVLLLPVFCLSCDNISEKTAFRLSENVTLVKNPMYSPQNEDSYAAGDYGSYLNYFKDSDNIIGISASKPSALNSHRITGYCGPKYEHKTKSVESYPYDVKVNNIDFSRSAITRAPSNAQSLFGDVLTFSIAPRTITRSEVDECEVEMYVPELIHITQPNITTEEELLPLCYYDGFKLCWNADQNNENGVILILEWIGEMVIGNDIPDTHIRRTCVVDDDGETVLSNNLFEGIPDTAVCHLTVLRGNMEYINIEDESFNIMAESHEFLSFVLIREVTLL